MSNIASYYRFGNLQQRNLKYSLTRLQSNEKKVVTPQNNHASLAFECFNIVLVMYVCVDDNGLPLRIGHPAE